MRRNLAGMALIAALAACGAQRDAPADSSPSPPVADQPAADIPPATMASPASAPTPASTTTPAAAEDGTDAQAGFAGYGNVSLGTPAADMAKAWGGELETLDKEVNPACYFMAPKRVASPSELAFMIDDGKFVRYGTGSANYVAPGGGRVGMRKADIGKRYAGIEAQPHKYGDGEYLRVADPAGGNAVLIFETDGKGDDARVIAWRVGLPPQVDYVEGCA